LPLQLGVGVKGATELILRSTRYFVDSPLFAEREMCLVQLDFKNAFNSVNRPKMLQELRSTNPKLSPWVEFTYCKEAPLYIQGGSMITSQEGIQQGDPLATLLFSVAINPVVRQIATEFQTEWSSWYLDDGDLISTISEARKVMDHLLSVGPDYGLFLNSSKCQITGRNIDRHKLADLHLGELKFSEVEGQPATVILGSPLGPTHYVQDHVSNQQQQLKIFLDRLTELHDPQVALFLMRHSLGVARITHLLRTVDPTLIELQLVSMESSLLKALTQIVGAPLTASAWEQAGLAINLGGLGISHHTRVAAAAYVASSLSFLSKTSTLCLPSPAGAVTEMLVNAIRVLNQQTSGTVHVTRDWMKSPLRAPEHLESHHFSQHWWSSIVSFHSRNRLVSSVRQRQTSPTTPTGPVQWRLADPDPFRLSRPIIRSS